MKTSTEQMENCQVALNVELENAETEKYMALALDHLSKKVTLPGFRKGKAPVTLVEQQLGKQAILQEALEHLIPEVYEEALKSESITAIADPNIELTGVEPITFKAIVPTQPAVTPGNYKEIKLEMEKKEVTDSDIEQVIDQLKLQFSTLVPVERSLNFGDVVTFDIEGKRDGEPLLDRKDGTYEVREDSKYPVPGFAEKIAGMNKDEEKQFSITFPDDHEIKEIAGKEYSFSVKIKDIKELEKPEINDDFAKNAGAETVDELRSNIREGLQTRTNEQLKKEFENKLIRTIIDGSTIDFPPVLVDRELDQMIEDEARNFGDGIKGLENYLAATKKTIEQHREELKPSAADRVKAYLVTSKIGEIEGIQITDADIDQHIETMVKDDEARGEYVRALFSKPLPRESLREMMVVSKTMDLLIKMATGQDKE